MRTEEYLNQARHLDTQINSKLSQIESLSALTTKCTATLTDMPGNKNNGTSKMEDTILKIITLQEEINSDIDVLVDLKKEIMTIIKKVENSEYRTLLENRYLSFLSWEKIAVEMKYSIQQVYRKRTEALKKIEEILKDDRK
jgi:hypothetical protein